MYWQLGDEEATSPKKSTPSTAAPSHLPERSDPKVQPSDPGDSAHDSGCPRDYPPAEHHSSLLALQIEDNIDEDAPIFCNKDLQAIPLKLEPDHDPGPAYTYSSKGYRHDPSVVCLGPDPIPHESLEIFSGEQSIVAEATLAFAAASKSSEDTMQTYQDGKVSQRQSELTAHKTLDYPSSLEACSRGETLPSSRQLPDSADIARQQSSHDAKPAVQEMSHKFTERTALIFYHLFSEAAKSESDDSEYEPVAHQSDEIKTEHASPHQYLSYHRLLECLLE